VELRDDEVRVLPTILNERSDVRAVDGVGVLVGVRVGVAVLVGVAAFVGVFVGVAVAVGDAVVVGTFVGDFVAVGAGVAVLVGVSVETGVGVETEETALRARTGSPLRPPEKPAAAVCETAVLRTQERTALGAAPGLAAR